MTQQHNESIVDQEAIVTMANDKYFSKFIRDSPPEKISVYKLSCLYWIYMNMGDSQWDESILAQMENHLCRNINEEIILQKKLERERDDLTDASLQSIQINDLLTIESIYDRSENLRSVSKRHSKIKKLIADAQYWDKKETDRKWFHF